MRKRRPRFIEAIFLLCRPLLLLAEEGVPFDMPGALASAEEALQSHRETMSSLIEMMNEWNRLLTQANQVRNDYDNLALSIRNVELLLNQVNARQIDELSEELQEILQVESARAEIDSKTPSVAEVEEKVKTFPEEELNEMFSLESLLIDSERQIESWINEVTEREVAAIMHRRTDALPIPLIEEHTDEEEEVTCVSPASAVHEVQEALIRYEQDGIGMLDHAQGGTIVYEYTSKTFSPSSEPQYELSKVWWSKFIPEDLENVLPQGWETWNTEFSTSVAHTLGVQGGIVTPQTILKNNTHPGACWPMQGSSGQVTIHLPYPVRVSAITVEHANSLLLDKNELKSAPKEIQALSFPPCRGKDGLGFDLSDSEALTTMKYEIEGPRVQTFTVSRQDASDDEEGTLGSCSAVKATCGSVGHDTVTAAVRLEILSNWGNDDYTCIYRVRVHGERIE